MSRLLRSFKVIGTDTDRSASCDFLLVIYSNNRSISSTVSEINAAISVENRIFTPLVFNPPAERDSPWNFVTAVALKELE